MAPWRVVAASLVVGLTVLFAILFTRQRRRIRFVLRNRLTPLAVVSEKQMPIEHWLPWVELSVVVVLTLGCPCLCLAGAAIGVMSAVTVMRGAGRRVKTRREGGVGRAPSGCAAG